MGLQVRSRHANVQLSMNQNRQFSASEPAAWGYYYFSLGRLRTLC